MAPERLLRVSNLRVKIMPSQLQPSAVGGISKLPMHDYACVHRTAVNQLAVPKRVCARHRLSDQNHRDKLE